MDVQEIRTADSDRIREIDRSESARLVCVHEQGRLRPVVPNVEIPA